MGLASPSLRSVFTSFILQNSVLDPPRVWLTAWIPETSPAVTRVSRPGRAQWCGAGLVLAGQNLMVGGCLLCQTLG